MHLRLLALTALPALGACSSEPAPPASPAAAAAQVAQQFRLDYSVPELLDSAGTYYFQSVGLASRHDRSGGFKSGSYSSGGYESNSFNIAFFGADGTDAHLLLPHSRWRVYALDSKQEPAARAALLFYDIIKADTNQDGLRDGDDPLVLFVSDRRGRQLRQVTPDTVSVTSWQVAPPYSLLVSVQHDSDHDRKFGGSDVVRWLRYDLRNLQAPPAPLLPAALQATLQRQLIDYGLPKAD